MSKMYVLRRANGDLFTEKIEGRLLIPVWSSRETVERYKERNPELMIFLPARLDQKLMKKISSHHDTEGNADFFLLSEDEPDAYLNKGRPISLEEAFRESAVASQPAGSPN
jgi:hypothetical protein